MRILFVGDIVGRSGRRVVGELLPEIIQKHEIEFVVANGENVAGGKGITADTANQLFSYGVNVFTSGNHIFDKKESLGFIDEEPRLLRPANYPDVADVPGRGWGIFTVSGSHSLGIVNVCGRIFMDPLDCPFRVAQEIVSEIRETTNAILIDFHAEATSEKIAFKWFLDGQVSAIIGTHTHVQTADDTITKKSTAYITDIGMTGPCDSVIGVKKEPIIRSFITRLPATHTVAKKDLKFCGAIIDIDADSGRALSFTRLQISLDEGGSN